MAYCLIPVLLRSTTAHIRSLLDDPRSLLPPRVSEDLARLNIETTPFLADFDDAKRMSVRDPPEMFRLREMKEIAYCAEDVVAEYGYEMLAAKIELTNKISSDHLATRLRQVVDRFKERLKFVEHVQQRLRSSKSKAQVSSSFALLGGGLYYPYLMRATVNCIYGREVEKKKIIDLLVSDNTGSVSVLPIVGLGGVGKTMLAQLVYEDSVVHGKFDLRGWVDLSGGFCITTITRKILQSFRKKECFFEDQTRLQKELVKELTGRSFFVVLDGVEDVNVSLWECFLAPFLYAQSGKIIITTRNTSMATAVKPITEINLKCLNFKSYWPMFPTNVEFGKMIVDKCGGIPLFVKAIASVWMPGHVLESDLWDWISSRDDIPPLKIWYECLPVKSKQCFLFLALYPHGHLFFKDDLIKLWMHVGLLEEEGKKAADVGSLIFDELFQRKIVTREHGLMHGGFLVHDLVHDFARSVGGEDFAVVEHDRLIDISINVRYLSVIVPNLPEPLDLQPLKECRHLRVLQILNQGNTCNYSGVKITIAHDFFEELNHLRVLILRDTRLKTLPDSIGNSKLLHYLDLTNTSIEYLPQSACSLYYLQVLELTNRPLKEVPEGIENMVNSFGLCIPRGIGNLINLRNLLRIDLKGDNWHCALSELKNLVNLEGELFIGGLNNLTSIEEVKEANLHNKMHLEALTLDWSSESDLPCSHSTQLGYTTTFPNTDEVLHFLQPHTNLRELHIYNYGGFRFPIWLGDPSFTRLVKLTLVGGYKCEVLPTLGQLPYLESLSIQSMSSISLVDSEFCSGLGAIDGFQPLKMLEFSDMLNWSKWTDVRNGQFRSLSTLKLVDCPKLMLLPDPLSLSLAEMSIRDCEMLSRLPSLRSLRSLSLNGKVGEEMFRCLDQQSLRFLEVRQSRNIRLLNLNHAKIPLLQTLIIHGCRNLESVAGITSLSCLKNLKISVCQNLQISLNEKLPETLRSLHVSNCPKLLSWKKIQDIKFYAQLHMHGDVNEVGTSNTSQADAESGDSKQHVLGNPMESDSAYKNKESKDENEYSDQVLASLSTSKDYL